MKPPVKDPPLNSRVRILEAAGADAGKEGRLVGIQDKPARWDIWWTARYYVILDNGAPISAIQVEAITHGP